MASPIASIPPGEYVPTADQRILLDGVSWADFQTLLRLRGNRRYRMAYLDGLVELMAVSRGHEGKKSMIGCLIEAYCLDHDIAITPYGMWLQEKKRRKAAAEPDECYVLAADPQTKHAPDLAIEVVWTSGGLDKLEIYQRLEINEVWFWKDHELTVFGLGANGYRKRRRSKWVPQLDIALVAKLADVEPLNEAVKQLRRALAS
jgi:Uma2 family endonuclease